MTPICAQRSGYHEGIPGSHTPRRFHSLRDVIFPGKVEALFATSALVDQIYVHASRNSSALVCIVVATAAALRRPSPEAAVLEDLRGIALQKDFPPAAALNLAVHIETQPWTVGNGMLSGTLKICRGRFPAVYREQLDNLHAPFTKTECKVRDQRSNTVKCADL